jgi:DNA-directed RNA polymerase specialized sigma24 family protein
LAHTETQLKKLIKKASRGHRQSQIALYESYYGYCMSVALRFADNRENAQEIVNDAFLKALAKLDTVLNEASFKPWLRRIVINVSIDYYRKDRGRMHYLDIVCLFHLKSIPGFQFKSIPLLFRKQYLKKTGVPLSTSGLLAL